MDGFDLGVCDYLLKWISVERFLKALQKAIEAIRPIPDVKDLSVIAEENKPDELVLKTETKTIKIPIAEILYLESKGNYSMIITENEGYKIYTPLYKIEEGLSVSQFIRIHRSYIVSIDKIRLADAHSIKLGKYELPVGRKYKLEIRNWMKL